MSALRAGARQVKGTASRAWTTAVERTAGVVRRTEPGCVALTFDDGPHPSSTPQVLDVLAELGVAATFFCVGRNAREHPEIVARIRDDGHTIGSHSSTHPHPARTPLPLLSAEYREGRQAVAAVLGADTAVFRPPHGHLVLGSAVMIRRQGLKPWLWSVDPGDWRPDVTADHIATVVGQASSGDVVLLHDWVEEPWAPSALDRSATIAALPAAVDAIRSRGLSLIALGS